MDPERAGVPATERDVRRDEARLERVKVDVAGDDDVWRSVDDCGLVEVDGCRDEASLRGAG